MDGERNIALSKPANRRERRHGVNGVGGSLRERTLMRKLKRKQRREENPRVKHFNF